MSITDRIAAMGDHKSRRELQVEITDLRESLDIVGRERTAQALRASDLENRLRAANHFIQHQLPAEVANPWRRICEARRYADAEHREADALRQENKAIRREAHGRREENLALRAQVADLERALAGRQPIAIGPGDRAATDRHAQPSPDLVDTQPMVVSLGSAAWFAGARRAAAEKAGAA
ncbi:hypothetical protein [Phaeacidiphilus oryzae]|uniref:hypothetical protein n=1 Tax=Phaeacidiphilus oryzae TaxID=348818 RepID=UPI0005612081|nr:hypothetical protein [Phaeacidiphilus oryzae]